MSSIRITTFNLLHGMALTGGEQQAGTADPARLIAAAAELTVDVLGIQEVDGFQDRSGNVDQTRILAEALGAEHWRFLPTLTGTPGRRRDWEPVDQRSGGHGTAGRRSTGHGTASLDAPEDTGPADDHEQAERPQYGIGLISRFPVRSWHVRRFAAAPMTIPLIIPAKPRPRVLPVPDEPRAGLAAVIAHPAGDITVATAHLSFVPGFNVVQVRQLCAWLAELPQPAVLAGDFNLPGALPRLITRWDSLASAATYPSWKPGVQLDHILGRGLTRADVTEVGATTLSISDHCALSVTIRLPTTD